MSHQTSKTVNIVIVGSFPDGPLGPENISTIALFHLHNNLWDTLLSKGALAGIASSFKISQNQKELLFELNPNAKFSNGRSILASDVKLSLERLMSRENSGHINSKSVIKEVTVNCDHGIKIVLNEITPSFAYLLTLPEFGIVPKETLDNAGNVVNPKVTSGPYTVESTDFKNQKIVLKKNPFFARADANSPEIINLDFKPRSAIDENLINSGNYDFVELRTTGSNEVLKQAESAGYDYKITAPSLNTFMASNSKMIDDKSATHIASFFQKEFALPATGLETRARQILPEKTFGSLSDSEIPILLAKHHDRLPKEIVIKGAKESDYLAVEVKKIFTKMGIAARFTTWESQEPYHYFILGQGMNTEFPEIELQLLTQSAYAMFDLSEHSKKLLNRVFHESENASRSKLIKKLGTELLTTGKIIPLTSRAYVNAFKPDRISLNGITNYDGDIPFYQLQVNK